MANEKDDPENERSTEAIGEAQQTDVVKSIEQSPASRIKDPVRKTSVSTPTRATGSSTPKSSSMAPPPRPVASTKKRSALDTPKQIAVRPKTPSRSSQTTTVDRMIEKINKQRSPTPPMERSRGAAILQAQPSSTAAHTTNAAGSTNGAREASTHDVAASKDDQVEDATSCINDEQDEWSPSDQLPEFNWDDLAQRHAQTLKEFGQQEQAAIEDFRRTMQARIALF